MESRDRARRHEKWRRLDWLADHSALDRQRRCMATAVGSAVAVTRTANGAGSFAGAAPCGIRSCPNCGPRIAATRREEIALAVGAWIAQGGRVLFGTLTIAHERTDSLEWLLDVERKCWAAVSTGSSWTRDRARHGIAGFVWTVETTLGGSGWHPHRHYLLFIEPPSSASRIASPLESSSLVPVPRTLTPQGGGGADGGAGRSDDAALLDSIHGRWAARAAKWGVRAVRAAADLHDATDGDLDELAGYLAKGDLAAELTGSLTKGGKGLSPMDLLAAAVAGQAWFVPRWQEYERAQVGRRQIGWSVGIRARLNLAEQEQTDEEAAASAPEEPAEVLVLVPAAGWRLLSRKKKRGQVLRWVDDGADASALVGLLAGLGIAALIPESPPPG